jgi:hypothetical protein
MNPMERLGGGGGSGGVIRCGKHSKRVVLIMSQIISLLGQRYADLLESSLLGQNMPQPELIGDQSYVSLPEYGLSLVLPDHETIAVIQMHSAGREGFSEFQGAVPGKVAFKMSRTEVRSQMGAPSLHGEKQVIPVLGAKPAWDIYVFDGLRMHIEYSQTAESVQLISLTTV